MDFWYIDAVERDSANAFATQERVSAILESCVKRDRQGSEAMRLLRRILSHEAEEITEPFVQNGVVTVLLQFISECGPFYTPQREEAVGALYHISESVWFRCKIKEALEALGDPGGSVLLGITEEMHSVTEGSNAKEILLNCEITKDMYFPGKPWHDADFSVYPWMQLLLDNFDDIKEESEKMMNHNIEHPEKNICTQGWKVHVMYAFNKKLDNNCTLCPKTAALIEQIPNVSSAIFSYLHPRAHIKPHVGYYQYSEGILRVHLGLCVPSGCVLKVNGIEKEWVEREFLVFDDTFRHEAWNPDRNQTRAVLMFDVPHVGSLEFRNPNFLETSREKLKAMEGSGVGQVLLTADLIKGLEAIGGISDSIVEQV